MPTIKGVRASRIGGIKLASDKVVSKYGLEYLVIADNKGQGPITIRSTSGLPLVGLSTYSYNGESDLTAICKSKDCRQDEKQPLLWRVQCDFDNDPESNKSQEDEQNQPGPTARPPIVSWDAEIGQMLMDKDFSDPRKPVVNTVGDPFDPPAVRDVCFPVLVVKRFQSAFTPTTITNYVNKVNSGTFYGASAGKALITAIRANQVLENGVRLWEVEYRVRFAFEEPYHDLLLNNTGPRYRKTAGGEIVQAIGIRNLNANGTENTDTVNLHYLSFRAHPRVDFTPLALE